MIKVNSTVPLTNENVCFSTPIHSTHGNEPLKKSMDFPKTKIILWPKFLNLCSSKQLKLSKAKITTARCKNVIPSRIDPLYHKSNSDNEDKTSPKKPRKTSPEKET